MVETVVKPSGPSGTTTFPGAGVEAKLRGALLESTKSIASLQGRALPSTEAEQYAAAVHLDSLEVVNLLCQVEPMLGFEISSNIVKSGGYPSIDEAIDQLMPHIQAAWQKQRAKGNEE